MRGERLQHQRWQLPHRAWFGWDRLGQGESEERPPRLRATTQESYRSAACPEGGSCLRLPLRYSSSVTVCSGRLLRLQQFDLDLGNAALIHLGNRKTAAFKFEALALLGDTIEVREHE